MERFEPFGERMIRHRLKRASSLVPNRVSHRLQIENERLEDVAPSSIAPEVKNFVSGMVKFYGTVANKVVNSFAKRKVEQSHPIEVGIKHDYE